MFQICSACYTALYMPVINSACSEVVENFWTFLWWRAQSQSHWCVTCKSLLHATSNNTYWAKQPLGSKCENISLVVIIQLHFSQGVVSNKIILTADHFEWVYSTNTSKEMWGNICRKLQTMIYNIRIFCYMGGSWSKTVLTSHLERPCMSLSYLVAIRWIKNFCIVP